MRDRTDGTWDFIRYFRRTHPVPTDQLIECIRARDWQAVRQRTTTHPWDAQYRTHSGSNSTPLHLVCLYRAPPDVVQCVLDAHPGAVLATDTEGWTPLHVAFLYGADEETFLLLIRRGGANVTSIQSRLVGSPLHVACRHGVSTPVLKELLRANPNMVTVDNESGIKPATLLWNEFAKNPANQVIIQQIRCGEKVDEEDDRIQRLMDRIQLFLCAATGRDVELCDISLHELVEHHVVLDLQNVLALAVNMYPHQVMIRNDSGNLALHVASSLTPPRRSYGRHYFCKDAVDCLVESYPKGAHLTNGQGRFSLHLALSSKRTWTSGIRTLVEAAPTVLETRDRETGLYPAQLAASCEAEADDDLESLHTIYQLLRAWPPVLQQQQSVLQD